MPVPAKLLNQNTVLRVVFEYHRLSPVRTANLIQKRHVGVDVVRPALNSLATGRVDHDPQLLEITIEVRGTIEKSCRLTFESR